MFIAHLGVAPNPALAPRPDPRPDRAERRSGQGVVVEPRVPG